MADCISSAQDQTLASRRPHYGSFGVGLSLAVPAAFIRRLFMDPSRSAAARAPEVPPPHRIPVILLDSAQVGAITEAIRRVIVSGARPVPSLTPRQDDPSDPGWSGGGGDDDDDEDVKNCGPNDQILGYPPMQSLEVGGARLFLPGSTSRRRDARIQGDGVRRLSDVHENPWILKADIETFAHPCELTDESAMIWVLRLKITTKLVVLIMQELNENRELSEELKEECFAEAAGPSLDQLIELACLLSDARWSDGHISLQLTVFYALVDVLFNIWVLRTNRSGEVAGIITKMMNAFKGVMQRTSNDRNGSKEYAIHPATVFLTQVQEFFYRNRDMVQPILDSEGYNTNLCSDMINCWIYKINESAETMFEEKGNRYIFILNNTYFILQMKCRPGLLLPEVVRNLDALIEKYIMCYLDEYWFPPMLSYLDGDSLKKPRPSSLDKFTEEFFSICDHQKTWKVQTEIKKILRDEIVNIIVSKYVNFSEALHANRSLRWPSRLKGMWRARSEKPEYTGEHLAEVIHGLFER